MAGMVEMARDEPSFFEKVSECIAIICQAACDHHVKMQSGFISIALSVKVVEGSVIQALPKKGANQQPAWPELDRLNRT